MELSRQEPKAARAGIEPQDVPRFFARAEDPRAKTKSQQQAVEEWRRLYNHLFLPNFFPPFANPTQERDKQTENTLRKVIADYPNFNFVYDKIVLAPKKRLFANPKGHIEIQHQRIEFVAPEPTKKNAKSTFDYTAALAMARLASQNELMLSKGIKLTGSEAEQILLRRAIHEVNKGLPQGMKLVIRDANQAAAPQQPIPSAPDNVPRPEAKGDSTVKGSFDDIDADAFEIAPTGAPDKTKGPDAPVVPPEEEQKGPAPDAAASGADAPAADEVPVVIKPKRVRKLSKPVVEEAPVAEGDLEKPVVAQVASPVLATLATEEIVADTFDEDGDNTPVAHKTFTSKIFDAIVPILFKKQILTRRNKDKPVERNEGEGPGIVSRLTRRGAISGMAATFAYLAMPDSADAGSDAADTAKKDMGEYLQEKNKRRKRKSRLTQEKVETVKAEESKEKSRPEKVEKREAEAQDKTKPRKVAAGKVEAICTHTGKSVVLDLNRPRSCRQAFNKITADHRAQKSFNMDPALITYLGDITTILRKAGHKVSQIEIISGYRTPETNQMLREASMKRNNGKSGVAKHSPHMDGIALDFRVPGVSTKQLYNAACKADCNGVGKYVRDGFVHIDHGAPNRRW